MDPTQPAAPTPPPRDNVVYLDATVFAAMEDIARNQARDVPADKVAGIALAHIGGPEATRVATAIQAAAQVSMNVMHITDPVQRASILATAISQVLGNLLVDNDRASDVHQAVTMAILTNGVRLQIIRRRILAGDLS